MSLSSSQISGSRAAPRDPRDLSGRRPASIFNDRRQYKMAEESDDDEKMPPRKDGALASKGKNFRTKAIHRSFASTPGSARCALFIHKYINAYAYIYTKFQENFGGRIQYIIYLCTIRTKQRVGIMHTHTHAHIHTTCTHELDIINARVAGVSAASCSYLTQRTIVFGQGVGTVAG